MSPGSDSPRWPWLNLLLFLATVVSTLVVGTDMMLGFEDRVGVAGQGSLYAVWQQPELLLKGLPFSVSLLAILLAHEMGHYLTCRYYRISATLPYFIPAPTLVGTFGAFIRIRSPIWHRAALLEVGVAGPIAGFLVALPVLVLSISRARFVPIDSTLVQTGISLGDPLVYTLFEWLMGAQPPPGTEALIHPIGFAAWVGFLVTALNLLPVGQLDGGHIAYALSQRAHKTLSRFFVVFLLAMGVLYWPGWFLWAVLLLVLGLRHPPTVDDARPLEPRQKVLGWIALVMFLLCFLPAPIS